MIVADANIVIALSSPNHVHHRTAQNIVLRYGQHGIALHSLTMAEILVGPAKTGHQATARKKLTQAGITLAPAGDPTPEHLASVRATTTLTMPDACVLALAEHLGAPLATFDKRLAREAIARGTTVHDH